MPCQRPKTTPCLPNILNRTFLAGTFLASEPWPPAHDGFGSKNHHNIIITHHGCRICCRPPASGRPSAVNLQNRPSIIPVGSCSSGLQPKAAALPQRLVLHHLLLALPHVLFLLLLVEAALLPYQCPKTTRSHYCVCQTS